MEDIVSMLVSTIVMRLKTTTMLTHITLIKKVGLYKLDNLSIILCRILMLREAQKKKEPLIIRRTTLILYKYIF